MRFNRRQFPSLILLATYAGISILGDGLHSLMPEIGHQHHHGLYIVTFSDDNPGHSRRFASHVGLVDQNVVIASATDVDSHICEICQFLFQSISQPAQLASPIDWQPVVVAAVAVSRPFCAPTLVGPQAPRGPPLLLS
jgi:hypothetical protein